MSTLLISQLPTLDAIRTEKARRSLGAFVRQAWPIVEPATDFVANWHLDCIAEHLEAVTAGEIRNLLINIPPRHMKSLAVSVFWPVWSWLTAPAMRWLFNSYAESLSIRDSVKCRRIIESIWFQQRWGHVFRLTGDQNEKRRFENDRTGYRIAASVGGANTGEGGDIIVADDPHNVLEGESDIVRAGVLTWWDEVMSSRLNDPKTGARVIVMQRLHESDLSGHVLERDGYHHLCLPAEYHPRVYVAGARPEHPEPQPHDDCPIYCDPRTQDGELLWPQRFGPTENAALRLALGTYAAAGQLDQRPAPREGALFKSSHFRPLPSDFDEAREDGKTMRQRLRVVQYWDLAFSERDSADYTAAVTVGIDASQNLFILHVFRERIAETGLAAAMSTHIALTKPHLIGVEEGAYKQAATQDLIRRLQGAHRVPGLAPITVGVFPIKVTTDKMFRAALPAGRAQAGMVYADRRAAWWQAFETEVLKFPKAANDDQVDALSGACQLAIGAVSFQSREEPIPYTVGSIRKPDGRHWSETSGQQIMEHGVIVRRDGGPLRAPVR